MPYIWSNGRSFLCLQERNPVLVGFWGPQLKTWSYLNPHMSLIPSGREPLGKMVSWTWRHEDDTNRDSALPESGHMVVNILEGTLSQPLLYVGFGHCGFQTEPEEVDFTGFESPKVKLVCYNSLFVLFQTNHLCNLQVTFLNFMRAGLPAIQLAFGSCVLFPAKWSWKKLPHSSGSTIKVNNQSRGRMCLQA